MDSKDFPEPPVLVVDVVSEDRWEVIDELIGCLVAAGKLEADNRHAISDAVKKRESLLSTGIGTGVAVPHATTSLVSDWVAIIGRSRKGIDFGGLDMKPDQLVLLFLAPKKLDFQRHVNVLSNIAKLLHRRDIRDGLEGR
jgi:mannitol/fructose-specific phosphotransferase system IIA component (Ntr-type)